MDIGKAALLIALVYVLTNYIKQLAGPNLDGRITQLLVFAVAVGAVFLAAASVWNKTQVVGDVSLADLDGWSKVMVGLLIGGGATVLDRTESAVRNIGTPVEPEPGTTTVTQPPFEG